MTGSKRASTNQSSRRSKAQTGRSNGTTTLREVANLAGVSLMTVSNFMNNRKDLLRSETWLRVAEAVDKLNYRPNVAARGLRLSNFRTVGMLVLDPSPAFLTDPFTTQLVAGLSNHINQRGYVLALQGVTADWQEDVVLLSDSRTDAVCMFMSGDDESRRQLLYMAANTGQPIIVFQEQIQFQLPNICTVRQDDFGGGLWIGRHLVELGVRRPLWLAPRRTWPALAERERGLLAALSDAGLSEPAVLQTDGSSLEEVQERVDQYLAENRLPDAIVAANDQMGVAVLRCLRSREIDVPEQVKVTGFNAFSIWHLSVPLLTTVKSPAYDLGIRAGEELIHWFETTQFSSTDIVLPVTPVPANSTVSQHDKRI